MERAAEVDSYLLPKLTKLVEEHPTVGDARGIGLLTAIELVQNKETKEKWEVSSDFIKRVNALMTDVPVASKLGGMTHVRCDAGLVFLPRRPYLIAVMTKYGLGHPLDLEMAVVEVVRTVHETMVALDDLSVYGQGFKRYT